MNTFDFEKINGGYKFIVSGNPSAWHKIDGVIDFKCSHRVCTFYVENEMRNDTIRKLSMLSFRPFMDSPSVREFVDDIMKIYKYELTIGNEIIDINNIEYNESEGVIKCIICGPIINKRLIFKGISNKKIITILDSEPKYIEKFFNKTVIYFNDRNGTYGRIKMKNDGTNKIKIKFPITNLIG